MGNAFGTMLGEICQERLNLFPFCFLLTKVMVIWMMPFKVPRCQLFRTGGWAVTPFSSGFPGGSVVRNLPVNAGAAGDMGLIPGAGRSPGGGNGNPLHYACRENPTGREACELQPGGSQSLPGLRHGAPALTLLSHLLT